MIALRIFRYFNKYSPLAAVKTAAARAGSRAAEKARRAKDALRAAVVRAENIGEERKQQIWRQTVSLAIAVGVTAGSVVTVMAVSPKAVVTVDGAERPAQIISSRAKKDILAGAGITVSPEDLVVTADDPSTGNLNVTVRSAKHVTVAADGAETKVLVHWGDSVGRALESAGVVLGENDKVTPQLPAAVREGMRIAVKRRYRVNISADGKTTKPLAWEGNVAAALSQAGVEVGAEDAVSPGPETAVSEGMAITVNRVSYRNTAKTEAVAYKTVTKDDGSKNVGTKTVVKAGENGVRTITTREKLVDGKVASSSVLKSEITKQPVDAVVAVGTRKPEAARASVSSDGTLVDENGRSVSYRKVYTGRCTSYCYGSWTASGRPARRGTVAVNPNIIPYGTQLYICSPDGKVVYGYAVAADTGTAAMEGSIVADLYYTTLDECIRFGARTMNVYVLD